jgi:ATP-dependent RNA helicase DeaD
MTSTSPQKVRFADMPLSPEVQAGIRALGYELATPVQAAVFEHAMAGKDLMVQSKTGTGKTTAFGLPLVECIEVDDQRTDPQALVLCPTRELAMQVAEELAELGDPKGVRVLPIYGGAPMGPQLKSLKAGCDVIVGTPGRVLDHIRRRTLRLVHAHMAVLDEADEMLSMGFWEDVTAILSHLPAAKQTLLFSATLPDQIRRTALSQMREPMNIDISRDELTVEGILNVSYEVDDRLPKPRNLMYVLEVERPENAIIFVNTRDDAAMLSAFFRRQGFHALALTGELAQRDREKVMRRMKTGELQFLVATDIAARGIDISDLSHVVNYALPDFTEVYLHRVGRTGRIGKKGVAISLVSGRDEVTYTQLQRQFGVKFEKRTLPEFAEIQKAQAQRVAAELAKLARDTEITSFLTLAEELKSTEQGTEVIAFLLKRHFSQLEDERAKEPVELRGRDDGKRGGRHEDEEAESYADAVASIDGDGDDGKRKKRKKKDRERRRRDEGEERSAPAEEAPPPVDGRVRLFVSRGSNDEYSEDMIRALVLEAAGQGSADDVGRIQLRRTHAFVEVTTEVAHAASEAASKGVEREEKPVTIELARTRG